jgi:hypothetical protein
MRLKNIRTLANFKRFILLHNMWVQIVNIPSLVERNFGQILYLFSLQKISCDFSRASSTFVKHIVSYYSTVNYGMLQIPA